MPSASRTFRPTPSLERRGQGPLPERRYGSATTTGRRTNGAVRDGRAAGKTPGNALDWSSWSKAGEPLLPRRMAREQHGPNSFLAERRGRTGQWHTWNQPLPCFGLRDLDHKGNSRAVIYDDGIIHPTTVSPFGAAFSWQAGHDRVNLFWPNPVAAIRRCGRRRKNTAGIKRQTPEPTAAARLGKLPDGGLVRAIDSGSCGNAA